MTDSDIKIKALRGIPTTEPEYHRELQRLSLDELKEYKQHETRMIALRYIQRAINQKMVDTFLIEGRDPTQ